MRYTIYMNTTSMVANTNDGRPKFIGSASWITLFADASFCPNTGAYGWCFWIKHGEPAQTILKDGGGVGLSGSNQAEIEALRQGIKTIEQLNIKGKRIVIQSDCLGALEAIKPQLDALRQQGAACAYTKHVKGHQGHRNKRASVNTTCDRKAGRQMAVFRAQANKTGLRRTPKLR